MKDFLSEVWPVLLFLFFFWGLISWVSWGLYDSEESSKRKRTFCYQITRNFEDFERCVK